MRKRSSSSSSSSSRRACRPTLALVIALAGLAHTGPALAQSQIPRPSESSFAWTSVSAGGMHTCAGRTTGRLFCWGQDANGQLGDPISTAGRVAPAEVAGAATNWASVSAGDRHTCAVKTTGRLLCWGWDVLGQLGDGGEDADRNTPVEVAGRSTQWASVSAGGLHTCGIRVNGRLFCWGSDAEGQLGDSPVMSYQSRPVRVGTASDWTSVSAGASHTCGTRANGRTYCWGDESSGELGDGGTNADRYTPVSVSASATNWASVSTGGGHSCARKTTGRAYCWGYDGLGAVGNGGTDPYQITSPVEVASGATNWDSIDAGYFHTCAVSTTGGAHCWGGDGYSLGRGPDSTAPWNRPAPVAGGATDWAALSAGGNSFVSHTCGLRTTGRLYCWGEDRYGQIGDGGGAGIGSFFDTPVEVA